MDCPDLAILELSMSKINGIEAARQIVTYCPWTIILADNFHDFRRFGDELGRSGVRGFVLKSRIATDLVPAIEAVLNGGTWFDEAREHA
jgi:DNA-binding NarL/FixJ family response regulator